MKYMEIDEDNFPGYLNLNISYNETKIRFSSDSILKTNSSQSSLLEAWKLRIVFFYILTSTKNVNNIDKLQIYHNRTSKRN